MAKVLTLAISPIPHPCDLLVFLDDGAGQDILDTGDESMLAEVTMSEA